MYFWHNANTFSLTYLFRYMKAPNGAFFSFITKQVCHNRLSLFEQTIHYDNEIYSF